MFKPDYLKEGDWISVVSPSGKIKKGSVLSAVELLRQTGFDVHLGEHVFDTLFQYAGTDENRLHDLQEALNDPECKAVICSRGGYGAIRLAEKLDLSQFREHPKWLVGFSDITVLHALLQKHGYCSIHGAMPAYYLNDDQPTESFQELMTVIKGEKTTIQAPLSSINRSGHAKGKIIGGNLSILYSLIGTPFEPETDGKILFIEDLAEYLYHVDRMMYSLKLAGMLKNLKGLIVGGFTDMKDNKSPFGQRVEEIISNAVKDYDYPVCFGFPAGHIDRNLPMIFGADYTLNVADELVSLNMH